MVVVDMVVNLSRLALRETASAFQVAWFVGESSFELWFDENVLNIYIIFW
jgi:hypothetical protein